MKETYMHKEALKYLNNAKEILREVPKSFIEKIGG